VIEHDLGHADSRPDWVPTKRLTPPCELTMVLDIDAHGTNGRPFMIRRQYAELLHQVFDD